MKKTINKNIKPKKITAVFLALFMLISNFTFLNISVFAADTPVTMSVSMVDSIQAGNTFEARVIVNNTGAAIEDVSVSTFNSSGGVISVTTHEKVSVNVGANSQTSASFIFKVSANAPSSIYDITFTVSYKGNLVEETRRIRVNERPAEPTEKNPYFEKVSEVHPSKVTVGENMRIAFRFANMGGVVNNVGVKITYPDGVNPFSQTELSAGTMLTGQSYTCYFDFTVTNKAKAGLQNFTITVSGSTGTPLVYPIGITFVKSQTETATDSPNIAIVSTEIPDNIKQGEIFEIKAVVENNGAVDITAENKLQVKMEYPEGISELSSLIIPISSLKQGEQTEISFTAIAGDSIGAKYYPFLLHIDYGTLDEDDKFQPIDTKIQYVGLNVLADEEKAKNFSIEANAPSNVKPGEDFKVSVIITNNGEKTEKGLIAEIAPYQLTSVVNKSLNIIPIPELKSGESITKEVVFNASEAAAGNYCQFKISLTGKEVNDISQFTGTMVSNIEQPKIIIDSINLPKTINIGDTFDVEVTVSNTGAADAENIILTVNRPDGILNTTSNIITIDSIKSGEKQIGTVTFMATQEAGYGYKQFDTELSYSFKSEAGSSEKQYFGVTVNSPHLIIESVKIPSSIGINIDFNVEVAVKNTGADTGDILLSLAPQHAGLINKTANTVKIDNIKSGETIIKTFTFMASESAPNSYVAIEITLSDGKESIKQFSGTVVNNPDKKDEDKTDIPVVIISKFTYTNVEDENTPENNNDIDNGDMGMDMQSGDNNGMEQWIQPESEGDIFEKTSVMVEVAPAPAVIAGDSPVYSGRGSSIMPGSGISENETSGGSPVNPVKDTNAVYGGKTFIFTIELLNTHQTIAVKDLKITFSSRADGTSKPGGIFNPKSGSNTFFVETLNPRETVEQSIPLIVKSDAPPDSYGLTISLSYKNEDGASESAEEIINIPVQQELRFGIGDLAPIADIEMGDEAYVNVQFGNLGKSSIYNVSVRTQGDGFMNQNGTHYEGTMEAGKPFSTREFTLIPHNAGFINGTFIFTYEDADGNIFEEQQPFFFNVIGGEDMMGGMDPGMDYGEGVEIGPDGLPVMNPEGESEESGGLWLFTDMNLLKWAIIGAGGLLIIGAVIVVIVVVRKKIKKKNSDDDDDDL